MTQPSVATSGLASQAICLRRRKPAREGESTVTDPDALVERYIAAWHEPDSDGRRKAITELWDAEGSYVDPSREVRGYEALYEVVTGIHDEFVRSGKYIFRAGSSVQSHHNVMRFKWELADLETGQAVDGGLDVLVTDDAGPILADYKFIGAPEIGGQQNQFTERYVRLWQEPDADER